MAAALISEITASKPREHRTFTLGELFRGRVLKRYNWESTWDQTLV